jgi:Predicted transcriptional regulators
MTIAEVSRKYDISADTLRYYERIGLIPPVTRDKSGFRNYTEADCNWVEFIKCMRNATVSIEALAEYVSLFQAGDATHDARKALLEEQLAGLDRNIAEMHAGRERLAWKIAHYDDRMKEVEDGLL